MPGAPWTPSGGLGAQGAEMLRQRSCMGISATRPWRLPPDGVRRCPYRLPIWGPSHPEPGGSAIRRGRTALFDQTRPGACLVDRAGSGDGVWCSLDSVREGSPDRDAVEAPPGGSRGNRRPTTTRRGGARARAREAGKTHRTGPSGPPRGRPPGRPGLPGLRENRAPGGAGQPMSIGSIRTYTGSPPPRVARATWASFRAAARAEPVPGGTRSRRRSHCSPGGGSP
jgi:hypothetical protein